MPTQEIAGLVQRLVLLAWLNRQFGYTHNRDLLTDTTTINPWTTFC